MSNVKQTLVTDRNTEKENCLNLGRLLIKFLLHGRKAEITSFQFPLIKVFWMTFFKAHRVPILLSRSGKMVNDKKLVMSGTLKIHWQISLKGNWH